MLAIAAFGGDDVQIMQLGFANGATEYFKGPNIIEILEHDFDNSLAFRACRFTGIPIPFQHRVDGLPRLFGNVGSAVERLGYGGKGITGLFSYVRESYRSFFGRIAHESLLLHFIISENANESFGLRFSKLSDMLAMLKNVVKSTKNS